MKALEALAEKGWMKFQLDPELANWATAARPVAEELLSDPNERAAWLRCGGTWYAGVNAFPNEPDGSVPWRVPPLQGRAYRAACRLVERDSLTLDRAQISIMLPGYPQPDDSESEANFRFRLNRDAAHVDGVLRTEKRRRYLGEFHGFVLGIPLTETPPDASPMVVWEGSHEIVRAAFRLRLRDVAPDDWEAEDVTEFYAETRREIFQRCPRVPVHAKPGEAYLVHRLALHGVAPWGVGGGWAPRIIAYFRPDPFPGASPGWWLERP
ncbi:MAG: hypothetical protein AAGI13_03735 [Pseudomonadota bacterium]